MVVIVVIVAAVIVVVVVVVMVVVVVVVVMVVVVVVVVMVIVVVMVVVVIAAVVVVMVVVVVAAVVVVMVVVVVVVIFVFQLTITNVAAQSRFLSKETSKQCSMKRSQICLNYTRVFIHVLATGGGNWTYSHSRSDANYPLHCNEKRIIITIACYKGTYATNSSNILGHIPTTTHFQKLQTCAPKFCFACQYELIFTVL